jgi:hypothetical protein
MASTKPTMDTYADWISDHLQRSLTDIGRAVTEVAARHSAKGAYRGSATVVETFRVAHEHFEQGVKTALGELKRAVRITDLDKPDLRARTEALLRDYNENAKVATRPKVLREFAGPKLVDERLAVFDQKLDFALAQFDAGFLDPSEPEPPPSMSLTVGTMVGSAVQQGVQGATQHVSTSINIEATRTAAVQLSEALSASEIPAPLAAELRADLETIKAQLRKMQPSTSVLLEAGRSMRTITENLTANVLATPVTAGVLALLKALGLV